MLIFPLNCPLVAVAINKSNPGLREGSKARGATSHLRPPKSALNGGAVFFSFRGKGIEANSFPRTLVNAKLYH